MISEPVTTQRPEEAQQRGTTGPVIVHVMTVPGSLYFFLRGQASFLRRSGYVVHAISSPGPLLASFGEREQVKVHPIPMERGISPLRDLDALWRVWRELRRIRPDIVHAHTPKGGLLGMVAAWLARTPVRVYHLRGSPMMTASGVKKQLLRAAERVSCSLSHRVLAVSPSLRRTAIDEGLCTPDKITVVGSGSGNGVDATHRFTPADERARLHERARYGIPADALVVGFVGRLVRDKGLVELASAWKTLSSRAPRAHLLVVGGRDNDGQCEETLRALESYPRVHLTGVVLDAPPPYAAMDVVALPTYREGFPNVPLEAAAMALPVVATNVPGCMDAVQDGVTGTLVPVRDPVALASALERYLSDDALRARHGEAARRRVLEEFKPEAIWEGIVAEYERLRSRPGAVGWRRRGALEH
jgi:glycosyltransferase involved in cell wall biosynthesis